MRPEPARPEPVPYRTGTNLGPDSGQDRGGDDRTGEYGLPPAPQQPPYPAEPGRPDPPQFPGRPEPGAGRFPSGPPDAGSPYAGPVGPGGAELTGGLPYPHPADTADPADAGPLPRPAVARVGTLAAAAVAVVLFAAPAVGVRYGVPVGLAGCLLVQVIFVLSWAFGTRRPGAVVVTAVALACGLVADAYAGFGAAVSLAPLGYVLAAGLLGGAVGQLARGVRRTHATDSLAATMVATVGAVSVPALVVLARLGHGPAVVGTVLAAGGAAVLLARLTDLVRVAPRASWQVARGVPGILLGGAVGSTLVGALVGQLTGLPVALSGVSGLVVGLAAVFADVGVSFGTAGLVTEGEQPAGWPARFLLGPAMAVTVAAPAGYVLGVLVLLPAI